MIIHSVALLLGAALALPGGSAAAEVASHLAMPGDASTRHGALILTSRQTAPDPTLAAQNRQFVATVLGAVEPGDTASADAAEKALVDRGASIVPALRESLQTSTGDARGVLTNALVRLVWKIDPRALLTDWMSNLKGFDGRPFHEPISPIPVTDESLLRAFPETRFYVIRFRQFPVARAVPESLHPSNVFALSKTGAVAHINDANGLQTFYRSYPLRPAQGGNLLDPLKDAAYSWVRLSQEFVQDGFYKFSIPEDSLKVIKSGRGWDALGKAVVASGGRGEIEATLTYDPKNQLIGVKENANVQQGVRPICQATKLLDPDPIVRRMAEQDLLVMGTAARAYVLEQRALARPELQQAIDRLWQRMAARDHDFETGTAGTFQHMDASLRTRDALKERLVKKRTGEVK